MQQLINTEFNEQSLTITFAQEWQQEDIAWLLKLINQTLHNVQTIEHIVGADREAYRQQWQNNHFIVNFDVYSQSCWLEMEIAAESEKLKVIQQYVKK